MRQGFRNWMNAFFPSVRTYIRGQNFDNVVYPYMRKSIQTILP